MLLFRGMNTLRPILLALTAIAALSVACPAKANLITNPGFETGDFTGWTHAASASVEAGSAHSGNFGVEMASSVGSFISQSVATTPSATYTVSFFAGSIVPLQPVNLAVTFGGTVFNHLFPLGQTGYNEFTFNATASGANTNLSLTVQGLVPSTFFLDDISVEPAGVAFPIAAQQFLCSVALYSAWLACAANWVAKACFGRPAIRRAVILKSRRRHRICEALQPHA